MQTILGSGGAIGIELAKELKNYTDRIRLVSRNPRKVNENDELLKADLLNKDEVDTAVKDSTIVYITIGFPYKYDVWKYAWPQFTDYVLAACKKHGSKLVFFDNIYMYDKNHLNGMNEETPINPPSKKGAIRKQIAGKIMSESGKGNVKALIARSADFYGPAVDKTCILTETVIKPLCANKKANWLGSDKFRHSFTYTVDAAKATAILGNTDDAYNQVWHLPTAQDPPTGREWIEAIAREMNTEPKYRTASKFIVSLIGLFDSTMKELVEMMYQYDRDYVFDSSKFEKEFNFNPTSYAEGIKETIKVDCSK